MGQLKKLAGQTAIYGVSSILGRVLNYLLVPFHTRIFAEGEYGVVTELYAYVAFLNVIYIFGLETAFFRFSTKHKENSKAYFDQCQTLIITISFFLSGALFLFSKEIVTLIDYPGQERYVWWFASIMAIDALVAIPFAKLRLENKAVRFATTRIINILLNIGLNLFFYWEVRWPETAPFQIYDPEIGVGYVFLANLIANAVFLILVSDILFSFRINWNRERLREIFNYAMPLVFTGIAGVTNEMLSRSMLKYRLPEGFYAGMTNIEALGIFGACYKLSIFMTLSIQSFKYAAEPFFFSQAQEKNSPAVFAKVMYGYILFACFLLFSVVINLDFLGWLFLRREVYRTGLDVVPYLLVGNLFLGIYYNLSVWYKLTDKTIWAAYIAGFGAILTILLNYALIPIFGYMGSAYVTLVIYFLMVIVSYFAGQKHFYIPYKTFKPLLYIIVTSVLSWTVHKFHPLSGFPFFFSNLVLIVFYVFIILKLEKVDISKVLKR